MRLATHESAGVTLDPAAPLHSASLAYTASTFHVTRGLTRYWSVRYCAKDWVLSFIYRGSSLSHQVAGLQPVKVTLNPEP